MSYIKRRIERGREESAEYRAAYDEEVALAEQEKARREALMSAVANLRKAAHVTQHQVADAMKISQARVSQLERGEETLSVDRFLDMLSVLRGHVVVLNDEDVQKYGLESRVVAF